MLSSCSPLRNCVAPSSLFEELFRPTGPSKGHDQDVDKKAKCNEIVAYAGISFVYTSGPCSMKATLRHLIEKVLLIALFDS